MDAGGDEALFKRTNCGEPLLQVRDCVGIEVDADSMSELVGDELRIDARFARRLAWVRCRT